MGMKQQAKRAGRPISSRRNWVEECTTFSTADLLTPGSRVRFCGQPRRAEITISEGGTTMVNLITTSPNYSGLRYWFECPSCKRRCGRLYISRSPDSLGCRKCLDLVYEWQYRKDWRWRLCREGCGPSAGRQKRMMRIALSRIGLSSTLVRTLCEEQIFWGTINAAKHLPDIMADVVQAAMGHTDRCELCGGHGVASGAICVQCHGTGEVRVMGDVHALRLALAMFRVIR